MNREIKFRAWIDDSMWMVNGLACSDNSDEMDLVDHSIGGYSKVSDFDYTKDCVLMQYTGLMDKNGKEIYEGDIVTGINRLHEFKAEQNVHFLNGCFMFGNWNAHEFFNKHQFIEIIGNIYEDPELIEGGK